MSVRDIRDWRHIPASQIAGGLWQAGFSPFRGISESGVNIVVLAAREIQPDRDDVDHLKVTQPRLSLILCPLHDTESESEISGIFHSADAVATRVVQHLQNGRTVLVTCQVGRNRSGLISALALRKRLGISGAEAAKIVRGARNPDLPDGEEALSNRAFLNRLMLMPAVGR